MNARPRISIVVPVLNEEDNILPLVGAVRAALQGEDTWELILVDDGSSDATAERVTAAATEDPRIRLVSLARRYGQSTAMQAGFDHSRGRILVTMDGDLQNDPRDIPPLVRKLEEGYDLVAGYRMRRQDKWLSRKVPSWVANRIIRWITGVPIRDNGCSLKAYRRPLLKRMRLYSDLHRFIPALAAGTAGANIAEVEVRHHPRVAGRSSYGLSRVWKVLVDLLTIKMIRSFRLKPLALFLRAAAVPAVGALLLMVAAAVGTRPNLPSLVFSAVILLLICLSVYLSMLGLLAEFFVWVKNRGRPQAPMARELGA